jgi:hypothetical protein
VLQPTRAHARLLNACPSRRLQPLPCAKAAARSCDLHYLLRVLFRVKGSRGYPLKTRAPLVICIKSRAHRPSHVPRRRAPQCCRAASGNRSTGSGRRSLWQTPACRVQSGVATSMLAVACDLQLGLRRQCLQQPLVCSWVV